jgi:hypothetical protein
MTKMCYRLSSSRSFVKLFSLLAGVALGLVSAQQTFAQDFEFGWEPFPPSSWDGGWDADLQCGALEGGTTTLTRNLTPGTDSVVQEGKVKCTFTDTAPTPDFKEEATCLLTLQFPNLTETCDNHGKLTVTGSCPFKKNGKLSGSNGTAIVDCRGRNSDGSINLSKNPKFCKYAGTNPTGNPTTDCQWNMGYGVKQGSSIVPLSESQCATAFPATVSPDPVFALRQVFKFTQTYEAPACTGQFKGLEDVQQRFCHSDTWDGAKPAVCQFVQSTTKNTASGIAANLLTADTEYSPQSINSTCTPNKDNGSVTLLVLGNNLDPNTNPIDVQAIDQSTITVNGFKPDSCDFPNPDTLRCRVPTCNGADNIVKPSIIPGTKTATLQMKALMNDGSTLLVGDVEIRKVSP